MKAQPSTSGRDRRGESTRIRLLLAAEKIFARDGFEAAKLEEIASEAGYTRGAFYANFASKEELFFALLERQVSTRISAVEELMQKEEDPRARLRVFRKFFLTLSEDRQWSLLALEFKLFAIRHPEVRARLAAMNRRLIRPRIGVLQQAMEGSPARLAVSPNSIAMALSAVTNAVALEHMLDRKMMSETVMKRILARYFDGLIGIPEE